MEYSTDYWNTVDEIKEKLPKKIDKEFIRKIYTKQYGVDSYSNLSRMGLCGQDVSEIDMSDLTLEEFQMLTFDENTIFSKEQIEKFHPDKILNDAKEYYENMDLLKKAGITGEGVNVVIIDSPFNHEIDEFKGIKYNDEHCNTNDTKNENYLHGNAVTSALRAISPDANITFCVRDLDLEQENAEERHRQAALEYIQDVADGKIKADVISMSSSFSNPDLTEEIIKKLEAVGCTYIDADVIEKNFSYSNRANNVPYVPKSYYNITDEQFEEDKRDSLLKISKIKELMKNTQDEKELEKYSYYMSLLERSCQSKEELENVMNEISLNGRKGQETVNIISGGITITTNDNAGTKMYNGIGCNSWTIPQVAGLFSIAKQMDPNISYKEFCEVSSKTFKEQNNLNMVNPEGLVKEINERNIERAKTDERYAQIAKDSSSLIGKFDELKREKEYQKENPMIRERKPYNNEMPGNQ